VKQVEAYRKHAEECRAMASKMRNAPQRDQLLRLAEQWESLADDRQNMLRQQAKLAEPDSVIHFSKLPDQRRERHLTRRD